MWVTCCFRTKYYCINLFHKIANEFLFRWTQQWVKVVIAAQYADNKNLYFHWDADGAESLVCQEDGFPIQGLSCKRKDLKINFNKKIDENLVLFIQVSCTGLYKVIVCRK